MVMPHDDDQLWWLFCGPNECQSLILGPTTTPELAAQEAEYATFCDHAHAKFPASIRQMAAKLPPGAYAIREYIMQSNGNPLISPMVCADSFLPLMRVASEIMARILFHARQRWELTELAAANA